MKRALALLATAALATILAIATSCSNDDNGGGNGNGGDFPDELQLMESDDGGSFRLAAGGQLIVALPSNPSTGFSWSVAEASSPLLELDGEPRYVPPGSTQPVPGAAGSEVLTFNATGRGSAELRLEYRRPFEPGVAPARTFSATVEIR